MFLCILFSVDSIVVLLGKISTGGVSQIKQVSLDLTSELDSTVVCAIPVSVRRRGVDVTFDIVDKEKEEL